MASVRFVGEHWAVDKQMTFAVKFAMYQSNDLDGLSHWHAGTVKYTIM